MPLRVADITFAITPAAAMSRHADLLPLRHACRQFDYA